jgi:flagellar export protein FliJ
MRSQLSRRFRLATVLRVRKRQEDMRAQALAETQSVIQKAQHQRDELTALQRMMLTDADSLTREAFDAADVRRYFQYERHLARRVVDTDAQLAELKGVAEDRRAELEEASQKKKAIERLEDRHRDAVEADARYWDQRSIDEIATGRAYLARRKGRL